MTEEFVKEEDALKNYSAKGFRTPDGYTSDMVLTTIKELNQIPTLHILLIKRAATNAEGKPNIEGGKWAVPGGFVEENESADQAAKRELEEETGLTNIPLTAFGVFDKPGRDPRGWIISRCFYAIVPSEALEKRVAGDDAADIGLFPMTEALELPLAFDHLEILKKAFNAITEEFLLTTAIRDFLPETFSAELLYETLNGCTKPGVLPDEVEFIGNMEYLPYLEKVGEHYRFNADAEADNIYF
ncbi:NUDIX domain-containing protein [Listeria ivanovii]|uniref:Nudix hydrolase domain-containing protein n=1 Tax=Listeria ivanovii (strain ATCC BAA-678 / PAM 55) TaxID=881621 RepID=G2ZB68_LISIP|nr:NUDIX hydrolase [Listeria ivanovii]MBC1758880.1 NUDIX hydrolase [Listeria ivanovii]MBK3913746.1 NUDIX hydrolase [Listeria ivanovii subsp. ivanovii]MBK3920136.1 NUDIX hydrolase [Listeria ivanovii subsp. ivanovii]MBK3926035.1 NUDIX hydrolase [Listeria ivanovii subsp. ivanovii]MCJ1716794.1 NUDIX hydrolase [Listeria ivanovii]